MNRQRLGAMALGILLAAGAGASAQAQRTERFEIKAQPLSSALRAYAEQTGEQVVFFSEVGKGIECTDVVGEFTREEALERLLQSTGLKFERLNAKTLAITDAIAKAQVDHGLTRGRGAGDEQRTRIAQTEAPGARSEAGDDARAAEGATAKADSSAEESATKGLEEIIVTAQKREQSLQDVPMSVAALSGEMLERRSMVSLEDFIRYVPGVTLDDRGPGVSTITIRGIYNDASSDHTTGIYLGDIPLTAMGAFNDPDIKLVDMERVEVLRGPQGTLYGSGSMGGTLRYIPHATDLQQVTGKIDATYSQMGGYGSDGGDTTGAVNFPLIPGKLAVRVVGYYFDNPGYIDYVGPSVPSDAAFAAANGATLVYAQWAQGFRLGRPTGVPPATQCDQNSDGILDGTTSTPANAHDLEPDSLDSWELGIKSAFADHRWIVNAAVYQIDWVKMPGTVWSTCGLAVSLNAGGARSRGFELESTVVVTRDFRIDLGASLIDGELTSNAELLSAERGDPLPAADFQANIGFQYDFEIAARRSFVRSDYAYVSGYHSDLAEAGPAVGN